MGGSSSLPSHTQPGSQHQNPCPPRGERGQGSQPIPGQLPQNKSWPCHLCAVSSLLNPLLMEKEMFTAEKLVAPLVVSASPATRQCCRAFRGHVSLWLDGWAGSKTRDAVPGAPKAPGSPYSRSMACRNAAATAAEEAPCHKHQAVKSNPWGAPAPLQAAASWASSPESAYPGAVEQRQWLVNPPNAIPMEPSPVSPLPGDKQQAVKQSPCQPTGRAPLLYSHPALRAVKC